MTEGPGGRCELTYGVEGFEDVAIPVAFTPMALAELPEGTTIDLVRISDGTSLLEAPVSPTPGQSEFTCSFPLPEDTECFRVKASKTQETP